jgi:NADPH2:quinone reductase
MRALTVTAFGRSDTLEVREVRTPTPEPGEITIDVSHAAVGLIDVFLRRGDFRQLAGLPQPPYVPGLEVAGTVRQVGADVTGLRPGDHVATLTLPRQGGLAEVVVAPAALVVRLEGSGVTAEQAAAALGNAATAYLALTDAARLRPGERVLVHGVTGALASTFPAVATLLGATEVVGTVRRESALDAARALGVAQVVLAGDFPAAVADRRFDVVVDPVGGELRRASVPLLARRGRLLVVGNASGAPAVTVDTTLVWQSALAVVGYSVGAEFAIDPRRGAEAGRSVLRLVADGRLALPVTVAPLDDAAAAFDRFERGQIEGRLLLLP